MKLRTLRVHGFKSFADATDVHFHDGITAIVGPNGCGGASAAAPDVSDLLRILVGI